MSYTDIEYTVSDRVATITLNRPTRRNAYTLQMADDLADAFTRADNDHHVRVVVLTGAGNDFCVGADLGGGSLDVTESGTPPPDWQEPAGRCAKAIFALNKPVIAAIRGAAVGAGSTIILPADYRIAATDTRFGYVFTRRGVYPEGASTWFLPRLVGLGRAMDWMVSGRLISAAEALEAGLVHSVHPPGEVLAKAYELAADLAANTAPVSVAVTRQLVYRMSGLDSPTQVHAADSRLIAGVADDPDAAEGVRSFLERRPPAFVGKVPDDLPAHLPWLTPPR